ncbi:MAG: tRNA (guanine(10)-N(2))-dimethyltransferase [Thermoprotei archaeon]|nr:MAG: tRNA (guanine(10)-N(2))-dimethyltransferase [Thermoprotei archaeon]
MELAVVKEGEVNVLVPAASLRDPYVASVFYNPRMEVSRDIAVCCLRAYRKLSGRRLRIAEPLTATGVRGIRYAKEVEGVVEVLLGDVNPEAVELARRNAELNGVQDVVKVEKLDANLLLSLNAKPGSRLDAVDLDPFGTPMPFVDSALRALADGGLLMLTSTDAPALCGVYPKVAERHYGGRSLRTEYCHELAVRLIIGALCREAAKHELAIKPLMAYSLEHHFRVCLLIEVGASKASESVSRLGYVSHCYACGYRGLSEGLATYLKPRCPRCENKLAHGGPLWCGPLQNREFIEEVLREVELSSFRLKKKSLNLLRLLLEEASAPPLYYTLDELSHRLKLREPSLMDILQELRLRGFHATRTHFHPKGFKTDAEIEVVEEVFSRLSQVGSKGEG